MYWISLSKKLPATVLYCTGQGMNGRTGLEPIISTVVENGLRNIPWAPIAVKNLNKSYWSVTLATNTKHSSAYGYGAITIGTLDILIY